MNISQRRQVKQYIKYGFLKKIKLYFSNNKSQYNELEHFKDKKKVFVMQTPTHGNLGDQAIAYAQKQFFTNNFKDYEYVEVPFEEVFLKAKNIRKIINPSDLIVIHGGGNMGDMYLYEELTRRFIVNYFKNVKIISFPQTISFSNTLFGDFGLRGTKKVYKSNENFFIVARETKSYEIMKKEFGKEKVILTPDIVLSLSEIGENNRKGIVTCFRNDIERIIDNNVKEILLNVIKEKYHNLIITDTVVNHNIPISNRDEELRKIWNTFRNAEVVLTDRLHGMIFCAITRTPCIVVNNFNHKIEYSYKNWLSNLDYIKFVDKFDVENIINHIEDLKRINLNNSLKNEIKFEEFSSLIDLINN
ncbi:MULTISPECIES: polysaccharide pyruvyl transferase family protein [Bacillaceae]|uniref:polysaccharide pyruvyl transferase family protein n=1 Tax=Bacillaceae TaxID=186817 RepID=UPI000660B226|nr:MULTISPECIES: polysaccharide pyruvyl transferase family protein [Bacillaceae]MCF7623647.1 polysaccharide pyruvyl transferase family protein [Peribacillus frigoritolerans]PRA94484.1 polysaccharide pyruvyl transferase [Peribacillus simplex]